MDIAALAYPPGKWQSQAPAELDRTLLWISHVLVRHEEVQGSLVSFNLGEWRIPHPPSRRTREQALRRAVELAEQARSQGDFAELARRFSEDPTTRDLGGSLGGLKASQLWPWPGVLDALSDLEIGQVSRPVETEFGFHVFYRRGAPSEQVVSGARLVIGHEDAPWLEVVARGAAPRRSRAEALAIANELHAQLVAAPQRFAELVERYSEHRDAWRGGDLGAWSTHEPAPFPREIEALSQLSEGEIHSPLETAFGVQLLQRTPNRLRQQFALAKLQLRIDRSLPDGEPGSRSAVLAQVRQMAATLRERPERFSELVRAHCCVASERIVEGRAAPAVELALSHLLPGQIAPDPIEEYAWFALVKRLPLDVLPPELPVRFDLP